MQRLYFIKVTSVIGRIRANLNLITLLPYYLINP